MSLRLLKACLLLCVLITVAFVGAQQPDSTASTAVATVVPNLIVLAEW
jgi:hypothetical protein